MGREGTPEEFAAWAAGLRGQRQAKLEADRALVESIHPAEPEPEPDLEAEEFVAKLLAPKAGHAELIRRMHGKEE
jgi:hypothetical protein